MSAFNMQALVDSVNAQVNLPYEKAASVIRNMSQEKKDRLTTAQLKTLERHLVNYFQEQKRVLQGMAPQPMKFIVPASCL